MKIDKTKARDAETRMESCDCDPHEWTGRVQAGDLDSAPHASTWVCGRDPHRADATEWAEAMTGLPARFIPRCTR